MAFPTSLSFFMSWPLICSYSVSQKLSFSSCNNFLNKNQKKGGGGWSEERPSTLWNIFMIRWCALSHFLLPYLTLQKPYSHPCFPLILTQSILLSLSWKSRCSLHLLSFPCPQSLLHLLFPSGFPSCSLQICCPCSHTDNDLMWVSAGTSSHNECMSAQRQRERECREGPETCWQRALSAAPSQLLSVASPL